MAPVVHILIPAAGASRRMRGRDKLLLEAGAQPLLRRVANTALATGQPVIVTLRAADWARRTALDGLPLRIVEVADADLGMSRSLYHGLTAILADAVGTKDGLMLLPADMPDFTVSALSALIAAFRATPDLILRGATADQPGHPVIFPRAVWDDLEVVRGDEGGRSVLRRHEAIVRLHPLPGLMALTDLDTPEDWRDWQGGAL